jgi:O-antigen ligase
VRTPPEARDWPIAREGLATALRGILPGLAVGGLLIVAMALQIDPLARALAVSALLIALVLPASGLALVALLVPLHDVELGPIGFDILLVGAFAVGSLVWIAYDPPRVRVSIGVLLVAGYVLLSGVSLIPALSGYGWDQTSSSIALFLGMVAGFVSIGVAALVFSRRDARPILATVLVSATIAALVGIGAFLVGPSVGVPIHGLLSLEVFDTRAFGPFYNSNYLGFFVTQSLLLAIGWAVVSRGVGRILLFALAAIAAAALVATFSRGSLIGAAVGIVLLAFMHSRRMAVVALALVAVGVVVLYPIFLGTRLDITFGDTSSLAYADQTRSEQWRLASIAAGWGLFKEQPIFGIGFGAFHFLSPWFVGSSPVTYAHDWYVDVIAEGGIVGSVMFAAISIWLVVALWRADHPLRNTALAMTAAYAVSSFFIDSVPAIPVSIVTWLTIAAVLAPRPLARLPKATRPRVQATLHHAGAV